MAGSGTDALPDDNVEQVPSASTIGFTAIHDRIARGELRPGDRLPQERALAAELGISRNALREAVRALVLLGVLDSRQGSGTYVTGLSQGDLLGALVHTSTLIPADDVLDVVEARKILESAASELAASRVAPGQLEVIRDLCRQMDTTSDIARYRQLDRQFHQEIVDACRNATVVSLWRALASGPAWATMWVAGGDHVPDFSQPHHRQLVTAIESGNAALAHAVALAHVSMAERNSASFVSKRRLRES